MSHFTQHLIVTPVEGSRDGWYDVKRELPETQNVGTAVYFTPNGFSTLNREESSVTQFNSVYIDVDAPKGSTPDEVDLYLKKKIGEIFTTIEPSFIVRTKNGAHLHFLLEESLQVTEETTRNYKHIMNAMVNHFAADNGAKGINRVLRVPGYKHYKDINDPFDVHISYESPDTCYTLEDIAVALDIEYPAPIKDIKVTVTEANNLEDSTLLNKMFNCKNGDRNKAAWEGDSSYWNDNLSSTDMALVSALAFWTGNDKNRMERLWLQSPLGQRKKTQERADYRKRTIENSLSTEVYAPKVVTEQSSVSCEERDEYLEHLAQHNWDDDDWKKKLKQLETNYVNNFYKYFAMQNPNLLFELGEDKSYFNYDDSEGVYKGVNFSSVRGMVIQLFIDEDMPGRATETNAKNVLFKYRGVFTERGVTLDSFMTPDNMFPMKNGWFNLVTEELVPHSPERKTLFKSSIAYDKDATCPLWDKFLDEDLQMPADQVRVIDQFSGYLLTPSIEQQKSLFFDGRTGAGKSTIPLIWRKILGDLATQASLTSLEGGEVRFMGDVFTHRHFCFFDEANPRTRHINEYFQNLISNETIKVERKGVQEKPQVRNMLKIVVALNEMPDHMPPGMKRRYIHIKFNRSFTEEGAADPQFAQKIVENELSGVFNRMVRGLKDFKKMGGFTMIAGEEERRREYDLTSDDFSAFLADNFDPINDGVIRYSGQELLDSFKNEYPKSYNNQLTVRGFNKKLLSTRLPEFKDIEFEKSNGKRGYKGLRLKPNKYFYKEKQEYSDKKITVIMESIERPDDMDF